MGVLLGLTGGVSNPFAIVILAPVTVSASILRRATTSILAFLAIAIVTLLAAFALPLPWTNAQVIFPATFVGAVGIAGAVDPVRQLYVSWLAQRARDMSQALKASQLALVREQRMSAIGASPPPPPTSSAPFRPSPWSPRSCATYPPAPAG